MKTRLLFLSTLLLGFSMIAQETTVNLTMDTGYTSQVFYKLSSQTETSFVANSWDIAFLRVAPTNQAIRINGGQGIEVYEASDNINDWNTISVSDEGSWTRLYNSETQWNMGAFNFGSAGYGWGEYDPITHHVQGTVIFVMKFADGTYRKFINEDYFGSYTFKFSTWDGSSWSADVTPPTIENSNNPDNRFNYYSFQNETEVVAEPAIADWDMVFIKYLANVGGGTMYPVTGVLHNSAVTVAENDEPGGSGDTSNLDFSEDINTIGYDWKTFNGTGYDVNSDKAYYIKYEDDTVYRLYFTDFEGSSTGNITFHFEEATLGINDVTNNFSFGIYPNPSLANKTINIVYDIAVANSNNIDVSIYSMNGVNVYNTVLSANSGFHNKELNLSNLTSGLYVVQFKSDKFITSKKLILR